MVKKWSICSDDSKSGTFILPDLESSEQIDHLFPAYFHKINFHIFQKIYNYLLELLRSFKCNNTCEL